jgi:predicted O-methyltransferase YrrM
MGRVDPGRFLDELPDRFDDFPDSLAPRDPRFAEILAAVEGLATPNTLALLNHAVSLLPEGESYVEIGTFHGASLIAALAGNPAKDAVAIDSFTMRDGGLERVHANLARFGLDGVPTVLAGDAFELVRGGALEGRRVGVWYYDAAHDYAAQLDGLRIAEPHLAPGALLIVDDSDWPRVGQAIDDYLAGERRARRILDLPGEDRGYPQWWSGMQVLAWS